MRVQVHSSSELPLGHNENQKSLSNQSCLWSYLTNLRVKGILCSFSLDINKKQGKDIPESSTLEILQKISTENFLIRCRGQHRRPIKWRRYIRFNFVENSISKYAKNFQHSKTLESGKLLCFISIDKLENFKKSFATIASLNEIPLFPCPLFSWYKWKLFLWATAETQTAKNKVWMRVELEQDRTGNQNLRKVTICARLLKIGWKLQQISGGLSVHQKSLTSLCDGNWSLER